MLCKILPLRQALSRAICKFFVHLLQVCQWTLVVDCLYGHVTTLYDDTYGFLRDGMCHRFSLRARSRACESFRGAWNPRMVSPILFQPNRVTVFYSEKIPSSFGIFLFILMPWYADEGPFSKRREHVSPLGMPMGMWWAIAIAITVLCDDISQSKICAHLAANVHTF